MAFVAQQLARWAHQLVPEDTDLRLGQRALVDTLAVALAARDDELVRLAGTLPDAARWAAVAHVLDYDDLHIASTTHISAVCVPAVLATGGDVRAYLAGAGVMARLGVRTGLAALLLWLARHLHSGCARRRRRRVYCARPLGAADG